MLNRSPPGDPHDTTTPARHGGQLRRFVLGKVLSPASRERLTGWMIDCKTGDNRLRGGLPKAWRIGDKTGNNGKDASGDIAVAWPRPDGRADLRLRPGRLASGCATGHAVCGNRPDGRGSGWGDCSSLAKMQSI